MRLTQTFIVTALIPISLFAQNYPPNPGQVITLRDGNQFTGTLVTAAQRSVTFRERGGNLRRFNFDQIRSIDFDLVRLESRDRNPPPPIYQNNRGPMRVPAGSEIGIRTNQSIDSRDASEANSYQAQVERDVLDDRGNVVIPRGSNAWLVVRRIGNNDLTLDLQSVAVGGQQYAVETESITASGRDGVGSNKRTGQCVGGGAVLGAIIGAIAGGGKGAGIGAIAGGAAGAGTQMITRGDRVRVPPESVLNFRLEEPINLSPMR